MIRYCFIIMFFIVATASNSYALTTYGRTLAVERCRGEYASEGCVQRESRKIEQMCSRNLAKIRRASKASIQKLKSSCRKYHEIIKICVNDGGHLDIPPQDVISGNVSEPYWDQPLESLESFIPSPQNLFPKQPETSSTDFKNKLIDDALRTHEPAPDMAPNRAEELRKRARAEYARTTYEQSKYYEEEAEKSTLLGKVKWGVENWFGKHNDPLFAPHEREMDIQARMRNATNVDMDNIQLHLHRNDMSEANRYSHEQQQLLNEQGTYAKGIEGIGKTALDYTKANMKTPFSNKVPSVKQQTILQNNKKCAEIQSLIQNGSDIANGLGTAGIRFFTAD